MIKIQNLIGTLIISMCCLSGCVIGVEHDYRSIVADLEASGSKKVAITTYDQRPEILSRETAPEVTGWQKGGYGNPFKVTTESGLPLAEDFSEAIASSLKRKGFYPVVVSAKFSEEKSVVIDKLKASKVDTLLLFTMYEWFSNCYVNTDLDYDLDLKIIDSNGLLLAEKRIKGKNDLGGSFWRTVGASKELTLNAFKRKIEELLNNPGIVKAIQQ